MPSLKILILLVLVGFALFDALVDLLNWIRLPAGNDADATRTREYQKEHLKIGAIETAVQLTFWALVFHFPILDILDEQTARLIPPTTTTAQALQGSAWIIAVSLIRQALSLPFSWFSTFSIEQRYGFNRTTPSTFVLDRIKGLVIGITIGAPLLALLLYFFGALGVNAWWVAWIVVTGFSLGLGYLAPAIILPLFNRFKPLEAGELRSAIEGYAQKENFAMGGTFVMDGSKRSSKRNAFFTGFGRFKKLVLFDTLIEKHTRDELMAIVAHEMGHFKLGHIPRMIGVSIATQGALFWVMGLFLAHPDAPVWIRETLLLTEPSIAGAFLLMSLLYAPLGKVLSVISLALSRKHEFEADQYSKATYGKAEALISALKMLEKDHLGHPNPHPLKVWMEYSHPPVSERARALGV